MLCTPVGLGPSYKVCVSEIVGIWLMYVLPGVIHPRQLLFALHNAAIAGLNSLVLCLCCIVSVPTALQATGCGPCCCHLAADWQWHQEYAAWVRKHR